MAVAAMLLSGCGGGSGSDSDPTNDGGGTQFIDGQGGSADCRATVSDLIYVLDDDSNLLSFAPKKLDSDDEPFSLIGQVECPAGKPIDFENPPSIIRAMAVDRIGVAWVLYNSGQLFHVSTVDASCQPTDWPIGSGGFDQFGMGFVSDQSDSNSETLFVSGGFPFDSPGMLGTIDPQSLQVETVSEIPGGTNHPELTGTSDGKLYGYFTYLGVGFVAEIDKSDSSLGEPWDTTPLTSNSTAWEVAHWGGRFYIFVNTLFVNTVYELDPATGVTTPVVEMSERRIIAAGVSTCAPTSR